VKEMLLILSNKLDAHTDIVIKKLRKSDLPFFRWNIEDFLISHIFALEIDGGGIKKIELQAEDRIINLAKDISAVWYRRPEKPKIHHNITDSSIVEFISRETDFILSNIWRLLENRFWLNNPFRNKEIDNKLYQLKLAAEIGLEIPPTLVTNNPDVVCEFRKEYGEVISKAVSVGHIKEGERLKNIYTHKLTPKDLEDLDSIRLLPTLFQAYVPKKLELRVTVIEDNVFSCAIESQKSSQTKDDWRRYDFDNVPHYPREIPVAIKEKLIKFLKTANLKFGAFDMVLTPDNRYVFLEVNPNGQWYWIEHLTNLPITDTLVSLFVKYIKN
jgi:glutathione synthase/RimK-type ligase-like ATP-grasp enzyme